MCASPLRRASRPEEIAPKGGMADPLVTDYVHHCRLAGGKSPLQRRPDHAGIFDVLAVTAELLGDAVVSDAREHLEGLGAPPQPGHLLERGPPGAVVPQHHYD